MKRQLKAFCYKYRRLPVLLFVLFVMYFGLVLMLVNLVPILHRFQLSVTVFDEKGRPVPDAMVGWQRDWGWNQQYAEYDPDPWQAGTTDDRGEFQLEWPLQEQPYWVWPVIGTFQFRAHVLRIEAAGFESQEIRLSDHLRGIPYRTPRGHIEIQLQPARPDPQMPIQVEYNIAPPE